MKRQLSRRSLFTGAAGIGGVFGVSDALTCAAHRALLSHQPLAREFGRDMITRKFPVNGIKNPPGANYQKLLAGRFADWRLPVDGLVSRPGQLSLSFLKGLPSRTQVTQQSCEEGWPAIASGPARSSRASASPSASSRTRVTSSSAPSTDGSTRSTWPMLCPLKPCSLTA